MKRRTFLLGSGGLSVAFAAGCSLPVIPEFRQADYESALGWIRFMDGRYQLFMPRAEIGQNIATALKQVACEELGVAWEAVTVIMPSTAQINLVRATVGSESVKDFALPLAQACATLRDSVAQGRRTGVLKLRPRPVQELRTFSQVTRWVGKRVPLEQSRGVVTGQRLYVSDIRRPGLLYGRVLRAPAGPDIPSHLVSMNEADARRIPGLVAIVRDARFVLGQAEGVGIVATTPAMLDRVERALDAQWQVNGKAEQADVERLIDIDRHLDGPGIPHEISNDDIPTGAPWDVDCRVDIPLAAHGAMEPRAAVAEQHASGGLSVWAGSQDVFYQRDVIAKRLDIPPGKVIVHSCRVGGAFGGKTICTVELEAALLAVATGRPVKVQWTRPQEFQYGFHRPPSSHRIRARVRAGRLDQWWHAFVSSHIIFTNAIVPAWLQRLTDLVGDNGVARGAQLPYRCPIQRIGFGLARLPVLTGPWRGLGAGPNALAIESAIDECARGANEDPLEFRIRQTSDPRLIRVLRSAKAASPASAGPVDFEGSRIGRGTACGIYQGPSYAAVVADVAVSPNGQIRVTHLLCAHDCGMVINPDQVRAQCEGNLVWGLGMVLFDGLRVQASRITAESFSQSPMPRMDDIPPMKIVLVGGDDPAAGAGESAIVAAAGAIANAIRDATGIRPSRFPVTASELAQPNT